ncbi:AraC-type DNA-binding protein [Chitinophaga terrae (ex Kim and Jung 2007)]|uniref:AraC-type DNA-binding protein n=2 Tax=Chitinophaga terrae (ex Kim and Jung 2007) TaxID=408074 RepID=A0A1H3XD78_9BACT|nr:helix-turn-helix domain-containing protein [Chitinophaga terrae (ex Kim and Jung 2007)]GEP89790.1 hypothetical protein CTE07_14350 [Chitinophaga terrae (ex Kim and Jung 2007)]SDZ97283.1 AraC-type DNA-binding protein [Chitinophaga terrae (ex Kim and Jung 2007)]
MPGQQKPQRNWKVRQLANIDATKNPHCDTNDSNGPSKAAPRITETVERYEQLSYETLEKGCYLVSVDVASKQDHTYHFDRSRSNGFYCLSFTTIIFSETERTEVCKFYNDMYVYTYQLPVGTVLNARVFCFTKEWLNTRLDLAKIDEESALAKILNRSSVFASLVIDPLHDQLLNELQELLNAESRSPLFDLLLRKSAYPLICQLLQVLSQKERPMLSAPAAYRENIATIAQYLDTHLKDGFPGIPFLARIGHMSTATMRRQFPLHRGFSAFEYYRQRQLDYAFDKLQEKGSIKELSTELGFNNPSNFTRLFKEHFGLSPAEFRKRAKNGGV